MAGLKLSWCSSRTHASRSRHLAICSAPACLFRLQQLFLKPQDRNNYASLMGRGANTPPRGFHVGCGCRFGSPSKSRRKQRNAACFRTRQWASSNRGRVEPGSRGGAASEAGAAPTIVTCEAWFFHVYRSEALFSYRRDGSSRRSLST